MKLNPQASQYLYVRYLSGSVNDSASAIAVDSAGNAYVAGVTTSPDFPVTGGNLATAPSTGTERSFAAKLDPALDCPRLITRWNLRIPAMWDVKVAR